MAFLAFGILLSVFGVAALSVALPALGWPLIALGAVLAVTQVAVGPRSQRLR